MAFVLIVGRDYCIYGQCTRVDAIPGQACQANYDCPHGLTCVQGYCTGGEGTCEVDDNLLAIGPSNDCASGFCRSGFCANFPGATFGEACDEDRDCAGAVELDAYPRLLNCGRAGSGNRRCGSGGAACVGPNAVPSGDAPGLCISGECDVHMQEWYLPACLGQCLNFECTDPTPSPGLRRRLDATQHPLQHRLCPKGFEPCPSYPKGYEVRIPSLVHLVLADASPSAST